MDAVRSDMSPEILADLLYWAITGIIPDTACPIAREVMWRDHYQWERGQFSEWIDFGGEGCET